MKKGNVIVRLAQGAVTTVAATALVAHSQASEAAPLRTSDDLVHSNASNVDPSPAGYQTDGTTIVWSVEDSPDAWGRENEREFRKLALLEVKGELTGEQSKRLDQLNRWRDALLCAPTAEEMLLQLKRDRLLSRMEKLLREYVEFEEAANKQRSGS